MKENASCTLCYVDQFLLTERVQGTRNGCIVEWWIRTVCSWRTVYFIFAKVVMKEIGLSFLRHESRQQPSTSRGNETVSMLEYEKHSHAIPPH